MSKEQILKAAKALPTVPQAISRLYSLLQDPESCAADFEEVIKPDPALSVNLLRLANSASFGIPRQVSSVHDAITLLGLRRVFEVATSASFLQIIPKRLAGYEIEAQAFWQHSAAVAVLSEQLNQDLKLGPADMIFTTGLLHDIGKLVICTFLAESETELKEKIHSDTLSIVEIERKILDTDHAEIGALLGEEWNLPQETLWAARWHHSPSDAPGEVNHTLIDLIHLADGLAHMLGHGADIGELAREIDPQASERLGMTVRKMEIAAAKTMERINKFGELFTGSNGGKQ